MTVIDLTHTLSSEIPTYDLGCGFKLSIATDYKDCIEPNVFRTQEIVTPAGIGTHMDAPAHCIPGGRTIEQLDLCELVTDCVVIKVDDVANENYIIMPEVVEVFEKEHGAIKPNTFVIFYTGWNRHWNNPEKYHNNLAFPSVHESTARLLVEKGIAGLGIDTLSADANGKDFPVHRTILGANKYLVENIANANTLPATGFKIFVLPLKIKEGTEAPLNLIAIT